MLLNKKIVVVLPAYNAAKTLKRTYDELPHDIIDDVILIDDASLDSTAELAEQLGSRRSGTTRTAVTAATRRPAMPRRSRAARTWW